MKNCPFCGESKYLVLHVQEEGFSMDVITRIAKSVDGVKYIVCLNCGARGPEVYDKHKAQAAWEDRNG